MARPRKHPSELHDNPRFPKFNDSDAMRLYRLSKRMDIPENIIIRTAVIAYLERFEAEFDKLTKPMDG